METIRQVKSRVALNSSQLMVGFMQELKAYELLTTSSNIDNGLEPIEDSYPHILHRPFIDGRYPIEDIREFAWAIGLDSNMHAIYIDLLSIGDITHTVIPSWSVYRGSYHYAANSIVIVHNHPSGNPMPSDSDITFTKEVIKGGLFLSRPLVDHIIMGDDRYYSFSDDKGLNGFNSLMEAIKDEEQGVKVLSKKLAELSEEKERAAEEKERVDLLNGRLLDEIDEKDQKINEKEREIAKLKILLKGATKQ